MSERYRIKLRDEIGTTRAYEMYLKRLERFKNDIEALESDLKEINRTKVLPEDEKEDLRDKYFRAMDKLRINPNNYIGRKGIFLCKSDYFWEGGDSSDYEEISKYKNKKFTIIDGSDMNYTFEDSYWDIEFADGFVIEDMIGEELN